jgi:hypothetical protein
MSDRCSGKCFLAETRCQHRIITDEIGQDDFYCVRSFEKDVTSLKDYSHAALAQSPFEVIATIERAVSEKRCDSYVTVLGTVIYFVRETPLTNGTFFHSVARKPLAGCVIKNALKTSPD